MTNRQLKKKLNLSAADLEEIRKAVAKAEDRTSGEIALAVTAESDTYAEWEHLAAAGTAFVLFLCLFPLSPQIYEWLSSRFWGIEPWNRFEKDDEAGEKDGKEEFPPCYGAGAAGAPEFVYRLLCAACSGAGVPGASDHAAQL